MSFFAFNENQEADLSRSGFKLSCSNVTLDLVVGVGDNLKYNCHRRGKLAEASRTFNFLPKCSL